MLKPNGKWADRHQLVREMAAKVKAGGRIVLATAGLVKVFETATDIWFSMFG